MSVLPHVSATQPPTPMSPRVRQAPQPRLDEEPRRAKPLMRKYEVLYLEPNGDIGEFRRIAPASPAFEDAFAVLARGSLIATDRGPVAVEDLWPGDVVKTADNGHQTLLWKGAVSIVPRAQGQRKEMASLTRLSADALGLSRPIPDLVLGPAARLFNRSQPAQAIARRDGALVPARDYRDGVNVIELTPPSPVQVYQLGFGSHHRYLANGVEIESHHPGTLHESGLRGDVLSLYMSLFPHATEFTDFGPLRHVRLRLSDLELWQQTAKVG